MRLDHMTITTTSTLADLVAAVRRDTSMWKRRRDRIARSLADIARLLGRKPSELPADPRLLPEAGGSPGPAHGERRGRLGPAAT